MYKYWAASLKYMKENLTNLSYTTWIEPLYVHHVDDEAGIIYLAWTGRTELLRILDDRYKSLIESALSHCHPERKQYRVLIRQEQEYNSPKDAKTSDNNPFVDEKLFNPRFNFDNFVVGDCNRFAEKEGLEQTDELEDVLRFIALHAKDNVRELEGSFNRVMALSKHLGAEISVESAKSILRDVVKDNEQAFAPEKSARL